VNAIKVAVIHDWLTGIRGGEKVLAQILKLYLDADIFTLICDKSRLTPENVMEAVESLLNKK
jgi:hypothetical protein